mgnify:CR=1 FL=1
MTLEGVLYFLLLWFILSIPASLIIARALFGRSKDRLQRRTVPPGYGIYRMRDFFRW